MKKKTYPEHEKLEQVKDKAQLLGEFLEWLQGEGNLTLAEWYTHEDRGAVSGRVFSSEERLAPTSQTIEKILGRFLGIDPEKLAREKDEMLSELRRANALQGTQRP